MASKTNAYALKKVDYIFLLSLIIIGIIFCAILYLPHKDVGKYVEVRVNGKIINTFSLKYDKKQLIQTEDGTNTLQIKNGAVTMIEANCKDKICENMNAISRVGETIVCLPHKVVLEIVSYESDSTLDAVTGWEHSKSHSHTKEG